MLVLQQNGSSGAAQLEGELSGQLLVCEPTNSIRSKVLAHQTLASAF